MSIVAVLAAIDQPTRERLIAEPEEIPEYLFGKSEQRHILELNKSWQAIHYMLTGSSGQSRHSLSELMFGGKAMIAADDEAPRLQDPEQVQQLSVKLQAVSNEDFAAKYNPKMMDASQVYPCIWAKDGEDGLEYLLHYFKLLKKFYATAAKRQHSVMLWIG